MTEPSAEIAGWTAVRVRPRGGPEAAQRVADALFAVGSMGLHEDGAALVTQFPPDADIEAVRSAVLAADAAADVEIAPAAPVDWSERWRALIGAHDLGPLAIVPPWLADGRDAARTIVIDPGMAFGTGDHPTTRGVTRLLPAVIRPGDLVADLGAGSAVLAIAAAKLGARRVAAIEFDPDAIGNAEENVVRNGVAAVVTVVEGDAGVLLPLVAPVRVVLANIISSVLIELLATIEAALAPDGDVVLSGILWEERPVMLEILAARGWRVAAEDHEDAWWSVHV
ncbi:MAG TPA: 50S ribosomal protein L11 methyltransferase, partial [Gemmatirosa sp.]